MGNEEGGVRVALITVIAQTVRFRINDSLELLTVGNFCVYQFQMSEPK